MSNGLVPRNSSLLLIATSCIVFLANAGLLVLQLLAGRYLAPFIGSSVETWTAVIGVFLTGIALGNWLGGKLADRAPSPQTLAYLLILGGIGSLAMIGWYHLGESTGIDSNLPLTARILLLALLFCLPPAFFLSLMTPLAIKLMLHDVNRAGRVAGLTFALSTLGCLIGNYATGFWLLADYRLDTITFTVGVALILLAIPTYLLPRPKAPSSVVAAASIQAPVGTTNSWLNRRGNLRFAYAVVFLASFCGMSLELTASRFLAPILGVSLYTWTSIIGVMLAATMLGNSVGGFLADRRARNADSKDIRLATSFLLAAIATMLIFLVANRLWNRGFMGDFDAIIKVVVWSFVLFFVPMFMLGTISPQVIRLCVTEMSNSGRVAGTVYAWSTVGAIVGTFVTGYYLIGAIGTIRVMLAIAFLLTILAFLVGQLWKRSVALYIASITAGGATIGLVTFGDVADQYDLETKYYAIYVSICSPKDYDNYLQVDPQMRPHIVKLSLDHLVHSYVDLDDPTWLGYKHEEVQGELLRLAASRQENTNLLVIGGGGYTFPRWAKEMVPQVHVDVVEIDPGVTAVAADKLGLAPYLQPHSPKRIYTHHLDGRQFVRERAEKNHYQLVMQDAVNDLSVPYHLLTKEYNDAVKATLTPDGAYLLTLINSLEEGQLWRAAVNTLRQSFAYVAVLAPDDPNFHRGRHVYVIYASDSPLDLIALRKVLAKQYQTEDIECWTQTLDPDHLEELLSRSPRMILTDQYAPVDNLMSREFRARKR